MTTPQPPAAPAEDIRKFQDDVRNFLLDLLVSAGLEGTDIDGGGCDSGAWQDFTMSEIRQGFNGLADYYHDRNEEQSKEIADLRAQVARLEGEPKECIWMNEEEDETSSHWSTGCGNAFYLEDGTPDENGMNYCPFCGNLVCRDLHKEHSHD